MLIKAIMEGKPVTAEQFVKILDDPVVTKRFNKEKENELNETVKIAQSETELSGDSNE